jgi:hypothetical protein
VVRFVAETADSSEDRRQPPSRNAMFLTVMQRKRVFLHVTGLFYTFFWPIDTLPASIYTLPASIYTLPASIYTLPDSIYTLPASIYTLPALIYTLLSGIYTR